MEDVNALCGSGRHPMLVDMATTAEVSRGAGAVFGRALPGLDGSRCSVPRPWTGCSPTSSWASTSSRAPPRFFSRTGAEAVSWPGRAVAPGAPAAGVFALFSGPGARRNIPGSVPGGRADLRGRVSMVTGPSSTTSTARLGKALLRCAAPKWPGMGRPRMAFSSGPGMDCSVAPRWLTYWTGLPRKSVSARNTRPPLPTSGCSCAARAAWARLFSTCRTPRMKTLASPETPASVNARPLARRPRCRHVGGNEGDPLQSLGFGGRPGNGIGGHVHPQNMGEIGGKRTAETSRCRSRHRRSEGPDPFAAFRCPRYACNSWSLPESHSTSPGPQWSGPCPSTGPRPAWGPWAPWRRASPVWEISRYFFKRREHRSNIWLPGPYSAHPGLRLLHAWGHGALAAVLPGRVAPSFSPGILARLRRCAGDCRHARIPDRWNPSGDRFTKNGA